MRTSVSSIRLPKSSGSTCKKSEMGTAFFQTGSVRSPSIIGGVETLTAKASFKCNVAGSIFDGLAPLSNWDSATTSKSRCVGMGIIVPLGIQY